MKQIQMTMCIAFVACCGAFAQAQVSGSGTTNYVPQWTSTSTLGNSVIYQNGGNVGLGTTSPQWALDVNGSINTSAGYRIGESLVLTTPGGTSDIALGNQAMPSNTGARNIAVGYDALENNTTGHDNTVIGNTAGYTTAADASYNVAVGQSAVCSGTTNTGIGAFAFYFVGPGSGNTALGGDAGMNVIGPASYNTLLGNSAGYNQATYNGVNEGSYNIAIGNVAGENLYNGNYNIDIANVGATNDSGIVRFGTAGQQTSFFAAGIRGVTTGKNNAIPLVVDSNGQLGTVSSSRRFKTDIQDMGEASRGLLQLRPVTFRYRKPYADGSQPIQYGLIAEEVAEVYPDLVAYGNDGQPESVKYQVLSTLLLNEVQRRQNRLQREQTQIQDLREKLSRIEALLSSISLAAQVQSTKEIISETASAKGERQ